MLEFARTRPIDAGTNLPGQAASAAWLLALPEPAPGRVVCLGRPPASTLAALAAIGADVTVVVEPRRRTGRDGVGTEATRDTVYFTSRATELASRGPFDLLWVDLDDGGLARCGPFLGMLAADGVVVVDSTATRSPLAGRARGGPPAAAHGFAMLRLTATPRRGAVRSMVPSTDGATRAFLSSRGLVATPRLPLLKHAGRGTERRVSAVLRDRLRPAFEREVLVGGRGVDPGQPPRYLRGLAAASGVDIDHHRWGLSATGRYPSQKALIFLFSGGAREPEVVVKASRLAIADPLVENEALVLRWLGGTRIEPGPRWPTVLFDGRAAGRSVVAEVAVSGSPFADRSTRQPACPYAADAIEGLTRLGEATAAEVAGDAVVDAIADVATRFASLYPGSADRAGWLIERLRAASGLPCRAVALHGDPGPQNLLVDGPGTVAFVDWENGERSGPPGWDVFHFARSYATWATRQQRGGSWLGTTVAHLTDGTPMTPMILSAVDGYRRRLGLAAGWVEPLFFANLVYLAVNQAPRLPADGLASGGYVRLLDRLYERRSAPLFRRLLASDEAPANGRPDGDS